MFNFDNLPNSHMPFITYGAYPDFTPKAFCCIKVGGKWKLHHYDGEWKRLETGLPEDATECSPTAELVGDRWRISFIAGGHEKDRRFYLYKIDGIGNVPQKIVAADVGYVWKNRIVFGGRSGAVKILEGNKITSLTFPNAEYLYRVSFNPNNPQELLISGQWKNRELFSWICNPVARTLKSLCIEGKPAYKAAFLGKTLYYAYRNDTDGFEERHIVETDSYEISDLDFDGLVKLEIEKLTQTASELLGKFTSAMTHWAKKGFKIADAETLAKRKAVCVLCEYWDSNAFLGMGKCRKCGCSSMKLKLETEKCPTGKW